MTKEERNAKVSEYVAVLAKMYAATEPKFNPTPEAITEIQESALVALEIWDMVLPIIVGDILRVASESRKISEPENIKIGSDDKMININTDGTITTEN